MKILTTFFALIFSFISHASQESQFMALESCYGGVNFSTDYMISSIEPKVVQVDRLKAVKSQGFITLEDAFLDSYIEDDSAYILTHNKIEQWDLKDLKLIRTIITHNEPGPYGFDMSPRGFTVYKDKIFVAHNRLGLSVINKTTGLLIESLYPHGLAQDVIVQNGQGYVITHTAEIINGLILSGITIFDPETHKLGKKTLLNGAPSSSIDLIGTNFYIGGGFFWELTKKKVDSAKLISSYSRVIMAQLFAQGKPFYSQGKIFTCNERRAPMVMPLP